MTELFGGPGHQDTPSVSPDGLWIAYEDGTGNSANSVDQVFVARSDGSGARLQISRDQGSEPRWSSDGSKIYFSNMGDTDYSVVDVISADPETGFRVSAPRELFTLFGPRDIHQVAPLDQRFFGTAFGGNEVAAGSDRFDVVLNVFDELKRLAPTGKNK